MMWLKENWPMIVSVLFALSEALGMIPQIKANSVFQLIVGVLKKAKELIEPPKAV